MEAGARAAVERTVREHCASGELKRAATAAIESYGPEILGFLVGLLHEEDAAREVFAVFCEDFWRGLKDFRWSCSLRTWSYALARHALYRTEPERGRRRRHVPLSQAPEVERAFIVVVTTTQSYLRTGRKRHIERIRESLDREQQMLLILRHDRGLSWTEIAQVLATSDEPVAAATLRKRYERLIRHLREVYKKDAATL